MEIEFISKTSIDTSNILTVQELKDQYLFGVPLEKDGKPIDDSIIQVQIDNATSQIENLLNLKIKPQIIKESKDFFYDDWVHWSYIKATYPVVCPIKLTGFLGKVKQTEFPKSWLAARKTNDGKLYSRILYMVPTYGEQSNQNNSVVIYGIMPSLNWFAPYYGKGQIPVYWSLEYVTGFKIIPADIKAAIGKLAAIQVMLLINNILIGGTSGTAQGSGMGWGITSKSISLDGLSQSLSSSGPQSGIFGATIKQYSLELGDTYGKNRGQLQSLIDYYNGILWGSVC